MWSTPFLAMILAAFSLTSALALPQSKDQFNKGIAPREVFEKLRLAQQFNAAVYSPTSNGNNEAQVPVTCPRGSCPLVEAHNATYLHRFANNSESGLSGFVALDHTDKRIIVVFKASQVIRDIWINDSLTLTSLPLYDSAKVHPAFLTAWESVKLKLTATIMDWRSDSGQKYDVTVIGRGLGGAVAALASLYIRHAGARADLITFGSPPVGDQQLALRINNLKGLNDNYRVHIQDEPLVNIPFPGMGLQHYGDEWVLTSGPGKTVTQSDLLRGENRQVKRDTDSRKEPASNSADDSTKALPFEDFDLSSPYLFSDVLGEVPGGADATQKVMKRLMDWMNLQKPVSMGVKDKVPFDGEKKPDITLYGENEDYNPIDYKHFDLPDPVDKDE